MRVDAYTATLDADPEQVLAFLKSALPLRNSSEVEVGQDGAINRWKYEHGVGLFDGRSAIAGLRWGGNGGKVNVELKGSVAPDVFGLIRAHYPEHGCTRMDVALDRTAPGLFDAMYRELQALAKASNPRLAMRPDGFGWHDPTKGRTIYVGSNESEVQAVLYEKGMEQQAKLGLDADPNWCRLELRVKPDKADRKHLLAQLEPESAWGWSKWTAAALEAWTGLRTDRVDLPQRETDDERALRAMWHQYGGVLDRQFGGRWHQLAAIARNQCEGKGAKRKRAA